MVVGSAPATPEGDGVFLDRKFVDGMRHYAHGWDGPVLAILGRTPHRAPFGAHYRPADLPFRLKVIDRLDRPDPADFAGASVIVASGDAFQLLDLPRIVPDPRRLLYVIEYLPETRRRILELEGPGRLRHWRGRAWLWRQEVRRRRAFRRAGALQANGFPAHEHYRKVNRDTLLFFDNRMRGDLLVTEEEMSVRAARRKGGAPLRLVHSGRLEPMKGAQDLAPIVERLTGHGVAFRLDVFGTGSLENDLHGLAARYPENVALHGAVDFEKDLVPFCRAEADAFLSCHRQSDPSCTYLEAFGCGLPVVGYANEMLARLAEESGAAFTMPLGDAGGLAAGIAELSAAPERLAAAGACARAFCADRLFEDEFNRRLDHARALAKEADRLQLAWPNSVPSAGPPRSA